LDWEIDQVDRLDSATWDSPVVPDISERLRLRIEAEYPNHSTIVLDRLRQHDELVIRSLQNPERMHAAIIRVADGSLDRLNDALSLARLDWRDLLVAAGLADGDWPARLSEWLDQP
jgi:hypothetical protein